MPSLSVIVSTRNRRAALLPCLRSNLSSVDRDFDLLVIDQSEDDSTATAVRSGADTRVAYHKSSSRGLAAGRNAGAALSRASLLAMTDDDCEVQGDWIAAVRRVFDRHKASMVFGSVLPGPHDGERGFWTSSL